MAETEDLSRYVISGPPGDFIFEQGDAGAEMFIIQEGQIEVLRSHAGELRELSVLEPGDFFGEVSLLEDVPRDTSARARTNFKLLKLDIHAFQKIIRENPDISISMLRKLSRRLRERWTAEFEALEAKRQPRPSGTERPGAEEAQHQPPAIPVGAVLVHELSGSEFLLSSGRENTVGRPDPGAGFVPDVDLERFDTHRSLSRRHAKILAQAGGYFVQEEMGTNGTFVNNKRVRAGMTVQVKDGDQIRFGLVETVFRLRDQ